MLSLDKLQHLVTNISFLQGFKRFNFFVYKYRFLDYFIHFNEEKYTSYVTIAVYIHYFITNV